jgi:prevent-host-death family protein
MVATGADAGEGRQSARQRPEASQVPGGPSWQVQVSRARLSALIDAALAGRPQRITRRGKDAVVLLAAADYDRLVAPRQSLVEFLRSSPLAEAMATGELDLERDRDPIRDLPR